VDGLACGLDHAQCCSTPVRLTLAEAVYISNRINQKLSGEERLKVIERAVATAQAERQANKALGQGREGEYCLSEAGTVCPLLDDGNCLLFEQRPLQCRAFGLDQSADGGLWGELITPALNKISSEIWLAYTGSMASVDMPHFALPDVVSGKFMETIFRYMMEQGLA
jgi:Fe-S-cluster containining protein